MREDNPTRGDGRVERREVSAAIDASTAYKPNDTQYVTWSLPAVHRVPWQSVP